MSLTEQQKEEMQKAALDQIKAVYEDGTAEINGRSYVFHGTNHATRKKVFAFYSSVQGGLSVSDMSFLDSSRFSEIEKLINGMVTFDDQSLAKIPDHWESYPEDYIKFITTALGVISYPFLKGSLTA